MACKQLELFRLSAADGATGAATVEGDPSTLLVVNPLAAPIFIRFGAGVPSSTSYDLVIPGNALAAWPLGPISSIRAIVDYPGAVPAGDLNQQAILSVTDQPMGAFVGAIA